MERRYKLGKHTGKRELSSHNFRLNLHSTHHVHSLSLSIQTHIKNIYLWRKRRWKNYSRKYHVPPESKSIITIFTMRRDKYIVATTNPPIIPLSMLKLESSHFCDYNFYVFLKRKRRRIEALDSFWRCFWFDAFDKAFARRSFNFFFI